MFELQKAGNFVELISTTKSNSGVSGTPLAKAHLKLGYELAKYMSLPPEDTTVVAILRGGMFFAEGIYFRLNCKFQVWDPKYQTFIKPETNNIVLVDSVINTGNTIKEIWEPGMYVACCVINEKAVPLFKDTLFTIRTSANSFIGKNVPSQCGAVGPDTTMRLFNQI